MCKNCQVHRDKNPIKKDFWKQLELSSQEKNGALFFQPTEDPNMPGHNLTFLQHCQELKKNPCLQTKPDLDLDDCKPNRCQVYILKFIMF